MALRARTWTALDTEAMRLIKERWDAMDTPPSQRTVAKAIGVTHPRIAALLSGTGGTPTVDEFCDLCTLFDLDPGTTLNEASHNIA